MIASDVLKELNRPVETINQSRPIRDAIQQLVDKRIGSLLVEDDDSKIVGIVSERDILRESAKHTAVLDDTPVEQIMTRELITGLPGDRITHLLGLMTKHRVRHLPIMEGSELRGMVSIGDLVKAQLDEAEDENRHLKDYIQGR